MVPGKKAKQKSKTWAKKTKISKNYIEAYNIYILLIDIGSLIVLFCIGNLRLATQGRGNQAGWVYEAEDGE